jgi:hypothetical protein
MANKVTVSVIGSTPRVLDGVSTPADAVRLMGLTGNYAATVNGTPAELTQELEDYEFVTLSVAVKGGAPKKKATKKKTTKSSK